jgi:23S rRNA (pseudouridine1915-N3)-methyltransferase
MKFSELDEAGWPDLQPYLDTCLLPVTGLTGDEAPWEMADLAARTGEWLYPLEQAFKGRTVTLPAYHYHDGSREAADRLTLLCERYRSAGFRFVILVCGRNGLLTEESVGADLLVGPHSDGESPDSEALRRAVAALWRNPPHDGISALPSGQA